MTLNKTPTNPEDRTLIINGVYRHFKGGLYKVIAEALHTETGEELVIYQDLGSNKHFARPKSMFLGFVDHDKYPESTDIYRMTYKDFDRTENLML